MMKKKGILAVLAVVMSTMCGVCSCSFNGTGSVNGDMKYTAEDLKPKAFKAIDVDVVADVYYTQNDGDKHDVRLDFSDIKNERLVQELKEKVKVVYRDGGVEIGVKGRISRMNNMNKGKRLKVYITSPDLVKVEQDGVGSFYADNINSDRLTIDNEGVGSIYIKQLLANTVKLSNEGVGSVHIDKLTGDNVDIDNGGVGSVKIGSCKGGTLKIDNGGVGSVKATVDCKSIHASLTGVGSVTLSGTTQQYHKDKDGVGSLKDSGLKVVK